MKKINLVYSTKNPFINLAYQICTTHAYLEQDTINLFNTILESNLIDKYSLNERFFIDHYENQYHYNNDDDNYKKYFSVNIFDLLADLNPGSSINFLEYTQFFNTLFNHGLSIDEKVMISVDDIIKYPNFDALNKLMIDNNEKNKFFSIYEKIEYDENKIIFFLDKLKNISFEKFQSDIKKYESYHRAVLFNKVNLINYFNENKVPVDILDINNNTPLMFSKNINTLKLIDSFNPNWFIKNVENQDAYSTFVNISDNDNRVKMLDYSKTKMELNSNNSELNIDKNYIENRVKENLINIVKSNKTKKEIQDFIRKNKIKNLENIYDKNGNNLFMISIEKANWARANLFLDKLNINHENKKGKNALSILLSHTSSYITRVSDMYPLLEIALNELDYSKSSQSIFLKLLKNQLHSYSNFSIPVWLLNHQNSGYYMEKLGYSKSDAEYFKKNKSISSITPEGLEIGISFYLKGFLNENKNFDLNMNELIDPIFNGYSLPLSKGVNYSVNIHKFEQLNILLKLMEELNIYINTKEFYNYLNTKIEEFFIEKLHLHVATYNPGKNEIENKEYNKNDFINKNTELLKFLADNNHEILTKLPNEIRHYNYDDEQLKRTFSYINLKDKIEESEQTVKTKVKSRKI